MTSGRSKNYILSGQLLEDREKSWKVQADVDGEIYFLSKEHCEMYAAGTQFSIPNWLATKMGLV